LELVNDIRTANGLPALKKSNDLVNAARYYSTDMGQDDYFHADHATYDGTGGTTWVCDMGDRINNYYTWNLVRENILWGSTTAQDAVNVWWGSTGHKANILSDDICETGVGYYDLQGSKAPYWTQDFGWRQGVYPMVINGEKATTSSTSVKLTICVPNLPFAENWDQMCVRNDTGTCTTWQSLQSPVQWTLSSGTGQKTVCVTLRNSSTGKTAQSCDTIVLTSAVGWLELSNKTVAPSAAFYGTPLTYTITLISISDAEVSNVVVTDIVPVSLTYDIDTLAATAGSYAYASGVITWMGSVNAGEAVTITFGATVSQTAPPGTPITNSAVISGGGEIITRTAIVRFQAAPVAVDDHYTTCEDIPLVVAAQGVLSNDGDLNDDPLAAILDSSSVSGTLSLNPDGSFTYTPTLNFSGFDDFTYHATDAISDSNVATVTLTVMAKNDPPVATGDSYTTEEDTLLMVVAPGVLLNDTDVEGDVLTAVLGDPPTNGTLALNPDGSFTYTPSLSFNGADGFTYHANDGTADSNLATAIIAVEASPVHDIYLPLVIRQ
jgi:uncharacterized repeat protein (TIGR01451 family)